MSLGSQDILDRLASHAMTLGLFDKVNQHEPKSAPGRGLTAAIWLDRIDPVGALSGLNSTLGRITFSLRIYSNMLQQPQDGIDPAILQATDELIRQYSGDFTLGGTVHAVDLLGMGGGQGMFALAGYLSVDEKIFRSVTLTIPVLVDDLWAQAE